MGCAIAAHEPYVISTNRIAVTAVFNYQSEFVAFALALVVSIFLTFSLKEIAHKIGLVDQPQTSNHKTHTKPAALVGGLGIFVAFCFTLLFINMPLTQLRPLLAGSIVLVVIGVLDDLHELSPGMRIVCQIAACLIMIFLGDIYLTDLGRLVTDDVLELSFMSVPFTIFAVVGVINAFNMSDGMDGQSGMLASSILLVLIVLCFFQGNHLCVVTLIALAGAVGGFLVFNLRRSKNRAARVFMGDAGSMFIGYVISWHLIHLAQGDQAVIKPITAVWIFALPICDTLTVMIRRFVNKQSPLQADNSHYHHLLQHCGLSINQILAIIVCSSLGLGALAYLIQDIPGIEKYMFYTYLLFLGVYYYWSSSQIRKI